MGDREDGRTWRDQRKKDCASSDYKGDMTG